MRLDRPLRRDIENLCSEVEKCIERVKHAIDESREQHSEPAVFRRLGEELETLERIRQAVLRALAT
jgi:hypothetical protein